jgi:hypothetical protein
MTIPFSGERIKAILGNIPVSRDYSSQESGFPLQTRFQQIVNDIIVKREV